MKWPRVALDLLKAREVLRERGWCQGDYELSPGGRCCSAGAIHVAVRGDAENCLGCDDEHYEPLAAIIADGKDAMAWRIIVDWNDRRRRTLAQVEAAFDAAVGLTLDGQPAKWPRRRK